MKTFTISSFAFLMALFISAMSHVSAQKYVGLSAVASDGTTPEVIFNGITEGARWQDADNLDDSWIIVDLGAVKEVGVLRIFWEAANASAYNLSFSLDGNTYTDQIDLSDMQAGERMDIINAESVSCRYIKLQGVTRQLPYGYSIYEFEVYAPVQPELSSISLSPVEPVLSFGTSQQFVVNGLDQVGNSFPLTETTVWSVTGAGGSIDQNGLFSSVQAGVFEITAVNNGFEAAVFVEVLPEADNVSNGKPATASSGNASEAFDGVMGTRWESAIADPQWLMVDLEGLHSISDIIVHWETANASAYIIEVSADGLAWTSIIEEMDLPGGERSDRFYGLEVLNAAFVRLTGEERTSVYGYSIWEMQVYGEAEGADPILVESISVSGENNVDEIAVLGGTLQMIAQVSPDQATDKTVTWSVDNEEVATISTDGLLQALTNGTVVVKAVANDGSAVEGTLEVSVSNQTTGAINPSKAAYGLSVFPNPVADNINLNFEGDLVELQIFSLTGQLVKSTNVHQQGKALNLSGLSKGVYFICITLSDGRKITERIIKK